MLSFLWIHFFALGGFSIPKLARLEVSSTVRNLVIISSIQKVYEKSCILGVADARCLADAFTRMILLHAFFKKVLMFFKKLRKYRAGSLKPKKLKMLDT